MFRTFLLSSILAAAWLISSCAASGEGSGLSPHDSKAENSCGDDLTGSALLVYETLRGDALKVANQLLSAKKDRGMTLCDAIDAWHEAALTSAGLNLTKITSANETCQDVMRLVEQVEPICGYVC